MDNTTAKSGSVFNMAIAYLTRIDKLLTQCSYYSSQLDMFSWQRSLRCLYREVIIKLHENDIKDIDGDDTKLLNPEKDKIVYSNSNFKNLNVLMNNKKYLLTKRREIFYILDSLEQKLRIKMQQKDMLLPGKDDPRYAVLRN